MDSVHGIIEAESAGREHGLIRKDGAPSREVLFIYTQRWVPGRAFEVIGSLGGLTLAARLRERGYCAHSYAGITPKVVEMIRQRSSRLLAVCFYVDFDNIGAVAAILKVFSDAPFHRLVGGPQTMHMTPEEAAGLDADAVLCGDGEESVLAYLEGRGAALPQRTTKDSKGRYELLSDFSSYPLPDDSLSLNTPSSVFSVISARGCPHRCAFCFEGGNSKLLRPRPVPEVLREIGQRLAKTPRLRYLFFADDTFTYDIRRLSSFCEGLKKLREKRDFVWFCEGHASFFRKYPGAMKMMTEAGMVRMQIGMESGCDEVLSLYGKKIKAEDIRYTARLAWEAGLPQLAGNFIIGGAGENSATAAQTREFALSLLEEFPGLPDISTTFPMPLCGTALTEHPERFGLIWHDTEFVTSLEDVPVSRTETLSSDEICSARSAFLRQVLLKMRELAAAGRIPRERILENIRLSLRYGIADTFCQYVYRKDPWLMAYAEAVIQSGCLTWEDAENRDQNSLIPQRTCAIHELGFKPLPDSALLLCLHADGSSLEAIRRKLGLSSAEAAEAAAEADRAFALVFSDFSSKSIP